MTGRSGIVCAGNWIVDIVHDIAAWPQRSDLTMIERQHRGLGGGAANVAADLVAMGAHYPVVPMGLIGIDPSGDELLELCREAGLETGLIARTEAAATAQDHVMNVPGDSRTFFYHGGANALFGSDPALMDGLIDRAPKIFYLGYLTLLPALDRIEADGRSGAARLLDDARAREMMVCVDLVSIDRDGYREIVEATLPAIDVLFANEVEAGRATGLSIDGAGDEAGLIRAAERLVEGGVRRAVVLHTPELVIWFEGGEARVVRIEAVPPEDIVSPVGAGDAFAAGILHGLHEGWSPKRSIALGCEAARACLGGYTATDGLDAIDLSLLRGRDGSANN